MANFHIKVKDTKGQIYLGKYHKAFKVDISYLYINIIPKHCPF
jgi:hypothetical protein